MSKLVIVRRPTRQAFFLPLGGTRASPNIIIPLHKTDDSELDELIRGVCEKHGLSAAQTEAIVERAERDYEYRRKLQEARDELHRRVREQAEFSQLKWGGLKPVGKRSVGAKVI